MPSVSIESVREKTHKKSEIVRQILRITNPAVKFEHLGAVETEEKFRTAAAGVALDKSVTLEEAEELLLHSAD